MVLSSRSRKDAELLLGLAKYHDGKKAYESALQCLDELIVTFPWFKHGVSEKALVLLKMGNWDQCLDAVERALGDNPRDIEALRIEVLSLLSREGRTKDAANNIRDLFEALKSAEPSNAALFLDISRCNARLSDGNHEVIQCNLALIEHAVQVQPDNGALRAERGYQRGLLEDFPEAMDSYKEALKLDESNEVALHGLIYCQIKLGQLDDAAQQMEFLSVIQESIGASAGFVFLQALLSWEKDRDRAKQVTLLQSSAQLHMDKLKVRMQQGDASTHELMTQLNPLFLVELASEFLKQDAITTSGASASASDASNTGMSLLEKLVSKSPGFLRAQFILAQAYFNAVRLDDAYQVSNLVSTMRLLSMHAMLQDGSLICLCADFENGPESLKDPFTPSPNLPRARALPRGLILS